MNIKASKIFKIMNIFGKYVYSKLEYAFSLFFSQSRRPVISEFYMYGINLTMRVINQILNELNKYDNP
jgi:hypothetical protein